MAEPAAETKQPATDHSLKEEALEAGNPSLAALALELNKAKESRDQQEALLDINRRFLHAVEIAIRMAREEGHDAEVIAMLEEVAEEARKEIRELEKGA